MQDAGGWVRASCHARLAQDVCLSSPTQIYSVPILGTALASPALVLASMSLEAQTLTSNAVNGVCFQVAWRWEGR